MIGFEIKNLKKSFGGVKAMKGVSLKFERGMLTSVIGPNGAGKSTFVNLVSGLIPEDEGVLIFDEKIQVSKPKSNMIPIYGMTRTFQNVRLFEQMTVMDNLLVVLTERNFFKALKEKHSAEYIDIVEQILKRINLEDKKDHLAQDLSYGQRKLLEIGRTLAMDQSPIYKNKINIYLFDEPFAGLFPEMVKIVVGIMKELRDDQRKTVFLIEHNMDLIRELSDYVYVLDAGSLLAEGDPETVLSREDVLEAYLGK